MEGDVCVNKLVLGNIAFGEVKEEEEAKEARKKHSNNRAASKHWNWQQRQHHHQWSLAIFIRPTLPRQSEPHQLLPSLVPKNVFKCIALPLLS